MKNTLASCIMVLRAGFIEYCQEELHKMGLSQGLLYFILYVGKHEECSLSELSEALHSDGGHTTRSVEKLVKSGFVERRRLPEDRRTAALKLTEKGDKAFQRAYTLFAEWDEDVMENMDSEQRKQFFSLLEQIKTVKTFREGA